VAILTSSSWTKNSRDDERCNIRRIPFSIAPGSVLYGEATETNRIQERTSMSRRPKTGQARQRQGRSYFTVQTKKTARSRVRPARGEYVSGRGGSCRRGTDILDRHCRVAKPVYKTILSTTGWVAGLSPPLRMSF
jgi:hypothetical protein